MQDLYTKAIKRAELGLEFGEVEKKAEGRVARFTPKIVELLLKQNWGIDWKAGRIT
jgi:hypothetical protein